MCKEPQPVGPDPASQSWPAYSRQAAACADTGCRDDEQNCPPGNVRPSRRRQAGREDRPRGQWAFRPSASTLRRQRRLRASAEDGGKPDGAQDGEGCSTEGPSSSSRSAPTKALQGESLLSRLESEGEERAAALDEMRGNVAQLAFDASGCRAVQLALELLDRNCAASLALEMKGSVSDAIRSPHANYVVQKMIEVLPMAKVDFIAEELTGSAVAVARHRYGCRIICRLVEHASGDLTPAHLMREVMAGVSGLCRHSFGHYAIQAILEHGSPEQRKSIADSLLAELERNLQNRNACYVLENALSYCSNEDRLALARALVEAGPQRLVELPHYQGSAQLVRAALRSLGEDSQQALEQLRAAAPQLQTTKQGRRLLEDLGLQTSSPADESP